MKRIILFAVLLLSIIISVTAFGAEKKALVVYFSRAGENYNVGTVSKGSTEIVAEIIAKETGADLFKIEPVNSYPVNYNETVRIARDEKRNNSRPKIKNKVKWGKIFKFKFTGTIFIRKLRYEKEKASHKKLEYGKNKIKEYKTWSLY